MLSRSDRCSSYTVCRCSASHRRALHPKLVLNCRSGCWRLGKVCRGRRSPYMVTCRLLHLPVPVQIYGTCLRLCGCMCPRPSNWFRFLDRRWPDNRRSAQPIATRPSMTCSGSSWRQPIVIRFLSITTDGQGKGPSTPGISIPAA